MNTKKTMAMVPIMIILSVLTACSGKKSLEAQIFHDDSGRYIGCYANGVIHAVGYADSLGPDQRQLAESNAQLTLLECLNRLYKGKSCDFSQIVFQRGGFREDREGNVVCIVYAAVPQIGGVLWQR